MILGYMGKSAPVLKFVDGLIFELLSTLMVFNLYPFGFWKEKDPKLLPDHSQKRPILLIHGIFHNHSAFYGLKKRLKRLGWGQVYTMNLSTYRKGIVELSEEISQRVNIILNTTKTPKVDIIAHSLGGIIARYYIQFLGGAEKIRHCVTLGTPHRGTLLSAIGVGKSIKDLRYQRGIIKKLNSKPLPKSVKFTSFWSPFDTLVLPPRNAKMKENFITLGQVQNIKITQAGHAGFLFSKEVCHKIANILDSSRKYPEVIERQKSFIENFALSSFLTL